MIEQLNTVAGVWWDWMAAMFWQVGLLIILIACIDRLIRRWAWPQLRYALWSLVLIKLILPPTMSLPSSIVPELRPVVNQALRAIQPKKRVVIEDRGLAVADSMLNPMAQPAIVTPQWAMDTYVEAKSFDRGVSFNRKRHPQASLAAATLPQSTLTTIPLSWQVYAMAIWLAGTLTLGIWLLLRLHSLAGQRANRAAAASLPQSFYSQMAGCAERLGLRRVPRVVVVRQLATPAVFGVLRPVLLMPKGYLRKLSRKDTEHMLLHELAHIKRGDLHAHGLYMLLQIIYWYNPLLWLVRRQLHHLRELSCDATVANLLREQTTAYRQTLLETARRFLARSTEPGLGLLGLFEDANRLVVRLNWLTKPTWRYRTMKHVIVMTIVALMFVCVLPMAQGQGNTTVAVENETSDQTQEARQAQELQELQAKLEKLEVERQKLQKELQALAQARQAAAEAKAQSTGAAIQAGKAKDAAAKVAAKAKAIQAHMGMEGHEQWAKDMQAWAEQMEQWEHGDAFKQWEQAMQKWAETHAKAYEKTPSGSVDPTHALPLHPLPPMPAMPPMPAAPAGVASVASAPMSISIPNIQVPKVVVPKVKVPKVDVAPGPTAEPVLPAPEDGQWVEATVEGEYTVKSLKSGATFAITNHVGSVSVVAGEGPDCAVKATVKAKGASTEDAEAIAQKVEIRITPEGDTVRVDAKLPDDIDEARREMIQVAFEVTVPPEVNILITQKVGSIHLAGLRGEVKAMTEVGDIRTQDLKGHAALRTNVGHIDMIVPDNVSAKVSASTRVGSVSSDLPLDITGAAVVQAGDVRRALGSSATGVLGTGEDKIKLDVNVGSIRIRSDGALKNPQQF